MFGLFFVHSATVETFTGAGPEGDLYSAPVVVKGYLDDGLVRVQSSSGEQLVQKSTFYADIADAAKFAPESRITVNGRASQVTAVRRREAGSVMATVAHVEVDLT